MSAGKKNKFRSFSVLSSWREILALLMLLLAIVFFRSERKELNAIVPQIRQANPFWVITGFIVTVLYIFLQAGMYKKCFAAIDLVLQWGKAVVLFLKRNFISVFLPAGGVSALAYSPSQIRKAGFNKIHVHQASGLYGFAGLLTVFLAGLPVIIITILATDHFKNSWIGLIAVLLIISLLVLIVRAIRKKGKLFNWIDKRFPSFTPTLNELFAANVNQKKFYGAVGYSIGVELSGMIHIYIAMLALGVPGSFGAAAGAYIISILMMVISPFLRGLGAVELSMVYVLQQYGYSSVDALSITILYRIFEFWLPLLAGLVSFAWVGRKLFFRAAPVLLTFALGIINIISAVTPPLNNRLHLLREYLPLATIHASNLSVLFIGLALLVTSAFLFRGLRNAWILALTFSVLSLIGHLTKALDYEEAIVAAVTVIVLLTTASQYRIHSSKKWIRSGMKTALISIVAVALFGFISFYFIDKKHFGVDFSWKESLLHTFKSFLLANDDTLHPLTRFGHEFVWLIRVLGFMTWGFFLFMLIRPNLGKHVLENNYKEKAAFLLSEFGTSAVDYFKLYKDKLFFFSDLHDAFIAYRISGGFAIVLEEPVCAPEHKIAVLKEFDLQCRKMGLKPAFYRVDENSIPWFNQLKKQQLMIGQEAILEIGKFNLEGRDKKSLRNGLNSLQKKGFTTTVHNAPHEAGFLSELKKVSDEWLESRGKREFIFSQGMFDQNELKSQDIITLSDENGNVKAFLNIIPDYTEDECTYDLIRKTNDAPGAAMDALIIQLISYAKEKNKLYLNLGMVPLTGITEPDNTAEQIIKIAADKIKRFQHYKGLREFKEKYATIWENKYLVYDNDFDLLQLPIAINQVMKP
ncbi:MAG TPA: phosphatidylglycerol lysyltransferase domain-containing protein [Chitinophagaceae bacterium]|nr:phosphatidylglycerol lysyltransferase domain-containing protein [Chitinophagaceae bacterium]